MRTTVFQMIQWKHAIGLEAQGIKVTGRSVRAHVCRGLGLRPRSPHADLVELIDELIQNARDAGAEISTVIDVEVTPDGE